MDRHYEQKWFRVMCGHNAPPERVHLTMLEYDRKTRKARKDKLMALLARKESGISTQELAAERGWSIGYTQNQLMYARLWYGKDGAFRYDD